MGTKHHSSSDPISEPKKRRRVGFSKTDAGIEPNDCITIYIVSSAEEVDSPNSFCLEPIDLNQFFEDDGRIFGYQGLKITILVSLISFHAYADISFESSSDGGRGITNVKSALENIFGESLVDEKDAFLQTFSTESQYVRSVVSNAETLQHKVSKNGCSTESNCSDVEVFRIAGSPVGQLYSRLVPLVLLLVDGSNPIDVLDPGWEIYLLVQEDKLLGFAAVYRFYRYPGSTRMRLGQILVMPPYQRKGYGRFLLEVLNSEHLLTGHKVAIKILNRRKMKTPDMEEKLRREIKICRLFVHPHVIRLYEVIETPTDIYVVMEYVKSGELFDYIVEKGRLQEDEARKFFQQIIAGVEYCHRNMVVHRDLKPENLLLDARRNVKIADFGLGNIMRDGHFLKTSCGSPNYAAPEVVSGKLYAGPEVDVWSCGVILYALLCGTLPFDDENIPNLFKKIKSGVYTLPSHLSPLARDLIPRMLIVDPMKRISVADIRQHQWFKIHLPRYLAIPPPDARQHLKKLDEEILQQVTRMGLDRDQLLDSLQKRIQDDATVAYYLLYDNRSMASSGYLGAEFQESVDCYSPGLFPNLDLQLSTGNGVSEESLRRPFRKEKTWLVGLQSPANPKEIMNQVLGTLLELNVRWKKLGTII